MGQLSTTGAGFVLHEVRQNSFTITTMYSNIVTEHLKSLSCTYGVFVTLPYSIFRDGTATVSIEIIGMGRFTGMAKDSSPDNARVMAINNAVDSSPLGAEG